MGDWILMLFFDLLIPITMIGFGYCFIKSAPKDINMVFGYRTTMSMKNKDTWKFAHEYCGKLWYRLGWLSLAMTLIGMLFVWGKSEGTIGGVGCIICAIQLVFLIGSVFPTEAALKREFDQNGTRR